jgi:hypothetical protein
MATYFQDPSTKQVVQATGGLTWLWQLLWSPIHFAYHNAWLYAAISFLAALLTLGLSFIVFAFVGYPMLKRYYRGRGWKEVPPELLGEAKMKATKLATLRAEDLKD